MPPPEPWTSPMILPLLQALRAPPQRHHHHQSVPVWQSWGFSSCVCFHLHSTQSFPLCFIVVVFFFARTVFVWTPTSPDIRKSCAFSDAVSLIHFFSKMGRGGCMCYSRGHFFKDSGIWGAGWGWETNTPWSVCSLHKLATKCTLELTLIPAGVKLWPGSAGLHHRGQHRPGHHMAGPQKRWPTWMNHPMPWGSGSARFCFFFQFF